MKNNLLLLLCSFLFLTSCGSVSLVKSWSKQNYNFKQDPAEKILLVALTKDETARRSVEDDLKSKLTTLVPNVQSSYNFVKAGDSVDKLTNFIKDNGFTQVITIRLANVDKSIEYTPGAYYPATYYSSLPVYYRDYGLYLNNTWGAAYAPGSFQEYTEYTLETNVYSIKEKGLVYSALTSSFKGTGFDKTVYATLDTIKKDMEKNGIFSEPQKNNR